MKWLVLLLMVSSSLARRLITADEIEALFIRFVRNDLSEADEVVFQEVVELLHRPDRATKAIETFSETRMTIDCVICRSAFSAAFQSIHDGQSSEQLTDVLTTLCTLLGIESYAVCRGAIGLNLPILYHIAQTTPEATPAAICGLVLQTATNPQVCPFTDDRFEWTVDLPPPPANPPTPIADDRPLIAAVMTDFHIDPLYEPYGAADCDEPTCCRKGQRPSTAFRHKFDDESIITRSIINNTGEISFDLNNVRMLREMRSGRQTRFGPRVSAPAGYWGDYRNCDTPLWAFDDAVDRIVETHKDIDIVYYIGDTIDHFVWETSYELINDVNRYTIDKMRASFGDVPVLPVIGNHESQPTNQFAPNSVTGPYINTTWLYEALADKWGAVLPEEARSSFRERGEYSVLVRPGLRVIVINNNVAYRYNWWLVYDPADSQRHLQWLVQQLAAAEAAGERVHILSHIPPGVHDLIYTWTREYNRIVQRFSSTIKAEFNGHTHSDEFKLFYDGMGRPSNVAWGAGSVTAYTWYNLNYKIVTFDQDTYEPQNIINYVYNLTEANLTPHRRPHWFQLYDMKNTFQLTDLSPTSMDDLVHRMVTTNRNLLDIYSAFFSKLSDSRMSWCNDDCKIDNICKIVVSVLWERQKCEELRSLFFSRS